ncbi:MAG: 2-iminoacetate synthase ThiH [Proteobacteria bacterium]|nr:2-iminoacetate synthase ThiH [Pseudomonadota bacterium]
MGFYDVYKQWEQKDVDGLLKSVTSDDVLRTLAKTRLHEQDYLTLLAPAAQEHLEAMAQRAHDQTVAQFGKTVVLYTPMYLSNYCVNHCLYCGFNARNNISRKHLDAGEVEEEARRISETGLKHILILTGESRTWASMDYLKTCVAILSRYFTSIAIEIYPLETQEYRELITAGVDAMTLYQETYNEALYDRLHVKGPKKNYRFRLDAPERACEARMRSVNIGALLGLYKGRHESFYTGLHAWYLQKHYPEVDISVSFPRMRPHTGSFNPDYPVDDVNLVQAITALRLFMPRAGITMSTRENAEFRNQILPLGVTRMSAGSTTVVGGHTQKNQDTGQFDISDERTVDQMALSLSSLGYQPVFKDWQAIKA